MSRYDWFRIIRTVALCGKSVSHWVAWQVGFISDKLDRAKREAVRGNLRVVLGPGTPESEIRRLSALTSRHFALYLAEFFGPEVFDATFVARHIRLTDAHHIDRAVARGTGAVIMTAHLSNWEIGAATLASRGYDVLGVAEHHPDERLNRAFQRMRRLRAYTTIPFEGSFRQCVKALKAGRSICFVCDRDIGVGGIEVDFFGRPTLFPGGPSRVALAAGATAVPGFVVRGPGRQLTVAMQPPIEPPARGDRKQKAHAMTQAFARLVEGHVRARPEQWGVFHRVWEG